MIRAALVLDGNELSAALLDLSSLSGSSSASVDWLNSLGDLLVDLSDLLNLLSDGGSHDVDLLGDLVDSLSQDNKLSLKNWLLWLWSSWDLLDNMSDLLLDNGDLLNELGDLLGDLSDLLSDDLDSLSDRSWVDTAEVW